MHVNLSDYEHASAENHAPVRPQPLMLYENWRACLNLSVSDVCYSQVCCFMYNHSHSETFSHRFMQYSYSSMDINLGIAYFTYCNFLNKHTACYEDVFIPARSTCIYNLYIFVLPVRYSRNMSF